MILGDIANNDLKVGIGTNNPDQKLTVKGKIHAHELIIDMNINNVPDYVFEKTYDLMPLSQLKQYVETNKHLPAIPSASEIDCDGLHLGTMSMNLLKKAEELTLYVLQLKDQNDALRQRLDKQQRQQESLTALLQAQQAQLEALKVKLEQK
jgi:Phage T4 tail fibre